MRKLTKDQKRDAAAVAVKKDADIDFSDAPPIIDWSGAEVGKFYRPAKRPVTIRLDVDVIEWLRSDGRGYQTKANGLLRHAMLHFRNRNSVGGENLEKVSSKPTARRRTK
ncbi:MAG TPA: BrnA antitoxin family protein [Candidatus Solibacter sp.]|nr:BrnA antitoxin family protein [Candidatus Solibacter sp.]